MVGVVAAALLMTFVFFVDRGDAQVKVAKNGPPPTVEHVASIAAVAPTEKQPFEDALDAERKARVAFEELEAKVKQLPRGDTARRNALRQEFLRQHGTTILASRVRVEMGAEDR